MGCMIKEPLHLEYTGAMRGNLSFNWLSQDYVLICDLKKKDFRGM